MRRSLSRVAAVCTAGLLSAFVLAVPQTGSASTGAAAPGAEPATPPASDVTKPAAGSKLSARLGGLARHTATAKSLTDQASARWAPSGGAASIQRAATGAVFVEIQVSDTSRATLAALRRAGASVTYVSSSLPVVSAAVLPGSLASVAALPQVDHVSEVLKPIRNAVCPTGVVSEGVSQLRVDAARGSFPSITGAGVKVGILSDSYNVKGGAPTDVANGELPGTGNPCGNGSDVTVLSDDTGGDEGRAMAQIVHDVAPGAELMFAPAGWGESAMADNIRALAAAGSRVIVDDITYPTEPMFQDGVIAKAVEDVSAGGVTFFSSAGNSNSVVGGRDVASYEAPAFRPGPCPAGIRALRGYANATCHDFDAGARVDTTQALSFNGGVSLALGWNEPQFGVATDLDFFVVDPVSGAVLDGSNDVNSTSKRPFEYLEAASANGTVNLVVARYAGSARPRLKWISIGSALTGNEYPVSRGGDIVGPTAFGHNISRSGASVGAVPFDNSSAPEDFSSAGPARYCWTPVNGTTPGRPFSGGCKIVTIDMAATDGGANSFFGDLVGGVRRFYGTSAAAPHAAGVAALLVQKTPCLGPKEVIDRLAATARPVGGFGANVVGGGLVDAAAAVGSNAGCATAKVTVTAPAVPAALTSSTVVRWSGIPPLTGAATSITSYHVQRALKSPGTSLGSFVDFGGPRTTTALVQRTKPGFGYCFRVRAAASNGTTSAWSAPRCLTMPTDDRALLVPRTGGWLRAVTPTAYLRTVTTSTRAGAILVLPASRGRGLALVVTKQPGGGTIGVYVKNRRVATVPTVARRVTPRVVVPLRVVTAGAPVVLRVDAQGARGVAVDGVAQLP